MRNQVGKECLKDVNACLAFDINSIFPGLDKSSYMCIIVFTCQQVKTFNTEGFVKMRTVEELAKELGIVSIKDLRKHGLHPEKLRRLVRAGKMIRLDRGLYRTADQDWDFHDSFALVAKAQPEAVICLSSALFYHHIGTQMPHEVWIALPRGRLRPPRLKTLSVRVFRYSPKTLGSGIDEISISGVKVRITSPARTVADCFKFRNKIGLDIALEALREGWRGKRFTMAELTIQERLCRVEKVMNPYVEAMVFT